jgi:hypothetical protein
MHIYQLLNLQVESNINTKITSTGINICHSSATLADTTSRKFSPKEIEVRNGTLLPSSRNYNVQFHEI